MHSHTHTSFMDLNPQQVSVPGVSSGSHQCTAANSPVFPGFLPFSDPSPAALPFCHFSRLTPVFHDVQTYFIYNQIKMCVECSKVARSCIKRKHERQRKRQPIKCICSKYDSTGCSQSDHVYGHFSRAQS